MSQTAHFASARAELVVVESPAVPQYEGGRVVATRRGKYHRFSEHRCRIEGQKSIDFMRDRMKAPDSPGLWEINASDVPEVTQLLSEMALANTDRVREILRAERDGPQRMPVLDTAQAILQKAGVAEHGPGAQPERTRHALVT